MTLKPSQPPCSTVPGLPGKKLKQKIFQHVYSIWCRAAEHKETFMLLYYMKIYTCKYYKKSNLQNHFKNETTEG